MGVAVTLDLTMICSTEPGPVMTQFWTLKYRSFSEMCIFRDGFDIALQNLTHRNNVYYVFLECGAEKKMV